MMNLKKTALLSITTTAIALTSSIAYAYQPSSQAEFYTAIQTYMPGTFTKSAKKSLSDKTFVPSKKFMSTYYAATKSDNKNSDWPGLDGDKNLVIKNDYSKYVITNTKLNANKNIGYSTFSRKDKATTNNPQLTVIYVHGGNWMGGGEIGNTKTKDTMSESYMNLGIKLLNNNPTVSKVIFVNYPLLDSQKPQAAPKQSLLEQSFKLIDGAFKLNKKGQYVLGGDSAGGQIIASYVLNREKNNYFRANNIKLKAVFMMSPVPGLLLDSASQYFNLSPRFANNNNNYLYWNQSKYQNINYNSGDILFGNGPYQVSRFSTAYMPANRAWISKAGDSAEKQYKNLFNAKYNPLQYHQAAMSQICANAGNTQFLIQGGDTETYRDDFIRLYNLLRLNNCKAHLTLFEGMFHTFQFYNNPKLPMQTTNYALSEINHMIEGHNFIPQLNKMTGSLEYVTTDHWVSGNDPQNIHQDKYSLNDDT